MFERYTESARRTLFFARYEVSQLGALAIEPEHLLLGLIHDGKGRAVKILTLSQVPLATVRTEIERRSVFREKVPTSHEVPFSAEAQRALRDAAEEADRLGHGYIGTEHLLLGLLRDEQSAVASILAGHGLRLDDARRATVTVLAESDQPAKPALTGISGFEQIEEIRQLADRLAAATSGIPGARSLLEQIRFRLDALQRELEE